VSRWNPRSWRTDAAERAALRQQAEADRLREQLHKARQARDLQDQRREALVDSVLTAVPVALEQARAQAWNAGWDAGWEAARRGLPKIANPLRPTSGGTDRSDRTRLL
jgi:hypothetical protein